MSIVQIAKNCPCCNGNAEWVNIKTAEVLLWQLSCNQCGMATCFDAKKSVCLQNWNRRFSSYRTGFIKILLIFIALLAVIIAFTLGMILGLKS